MVSDWRRAGAARLLLWSGAAVIRRLLRARGQIRNNGEPLPLALSSKQPRHRTIGAAQPATLDGLNQSAASVFERARIVDRNQRGVVGQCKDGPPLEPRRKLCRRLATASRELRGQSVRGIRRVPVPLCSSRVPGGSQRDPSQQFKKARRGRARWANIACSSGTSLSSTVCDVQNDWMASRWLVY